MDIRHLQLLLKTCRLGRMSETRTRLISILLSACLCLLLVSCGGSSDSKPKTQSVTQLSNQSIISGLEDSSVNYHPVTNNSSQIDYAISTMPNHGHLTFEDGQFIYTPDSNFNGSDQFVYAITDGSESARHTVDIYVEPVNDPPELFSNDYDFTISHTEEFSYQIDAQDVEGDALSYAITDHPESGTVSIDEHGIFSYEPILGLETIVSFSFSVMDKLEETIEQTVVLNIKAPFQVTHDELDFVVEANQSQDSKITIVNRSQQNIDFRLRAVYEQPFGSLQANKLNTIAADRSLLIEKGGKDPRIFAKSTLFEGGPDSFDYYWRDSDHPQGPEFVWSDISEIGTQIEGLYDDSVSEEIEIGFDFPFYNETYSSFVISSNGFISFDSSAGNGCCSGQPLPSNDGTNNVIAWMWADLHPREGSIHVLNAEDKVVIQFTEYGAYSGSGTVTAQVILNKDGQIHVLYHSFELGMETLAASIGIENGDASGGLQVAFNDSYLRDNLAIAFVRGEAAAWLEVDNEPFLVPAKSELDIPFSIRGANSSGGYEAELIIVGQYLSGEEETVLNLSAQITPDTTPPPAIEDLAVSETSFNEALILWSAVADAGIDETPLENYEVRLNDSQITIENWLQASVLDEPIAVLGGGAIRQMSIPNLLSGTDYYVAIVSTDSSGNASAISNNAVISTPAPPKASLNVDEIVLTLGQGETSRQSIRLENLGETDLEYQVQLIPVRQDSVNESVRATASIRKAVKARTLTALPQKDSYAQNRLVVRFKDSASTSTIRSMANSVNVSTLKRIKPLNMEVWELDARSDMLSVISELMARPDVLSAEPDYLLHTTSVPNDPEFFRLWGLNNVGQESGQIDADIDAVEAWDFIRGSESIVVGVIDTGIDNTHYDLADNIWVNANEIPGNGIDDDNNGYVDDINGYDFVNNDGDPMDDNSHGTHVAGTIGAVGDNGVGITGVAQSVSLMGLKFLDSDGSGTVSDAIEAIIYAVENGATVLNNSWGGGVYDPNLLAAIQYANDNGVLFVVSAGNGGSDNDLFPSYPSNYDVDNVVAVAALDRFNQIAGFSQFGSSTVDIGAPGVDIYSTVLNQGYESFSGTSMAAPHVSGVAALISGFSSDISMHELRDILLESAEPVAALQNKTVTEGSVNAFNAIQLTPPPWLRIELDALSGIVVPGEILNIPLNIDTSNLREEVVYEFNIRIETNDPDNPVTVIPVRVSINPDTIAPGDVVDLTLVDWSDRFAEIGFTATGDDAQIGRAAEYDIRFSSQILDEDSWVDATRLPVDQDPSAAGTLEQFIISGFEPDTDYFVALRVIDNFGLESNISNNIQFTTKSARLSYSPAEFDAVSLNAGEEQILSLQLMNNGDAELVINIDSSSAGPSLESRSSPSSGFESLDIAKGEKDPRYARRVKATSLGGPDNFGYRWIDSDTETGPEFVWEDVSTTGTNVPYLRDDVVVGPFPIGFEFAFYDQVFDEFYLSSNGFISFEGSVNDGCCAGQPLPSIDGYQNIISWLWYDLFPGEIHYQLNSEGNLIIQFSDYGEYAGNGLIDAQVQLNRNGSIELRYDNIRNAMNVDFASIGVENSDSSDGLQVAYLEEYVKDELAILIQSGWLRSEATSVSLEPGGSAQIDIVVDASQLSVGVYEGVVRLRTNDENNPQIELPIELRVN